MCVQMWRLRCGIVDMVARTDVAYGAVVRESWGRGLTRIQQLAVTSRRCGWCYVHCVVVSLLCCRFGTDVQLSLVLVHERQPTFQPKRARGPVASAVTNLA